MRKETSEWTVRMLVDFKTRIDVESEYQRGLVWTTPQQALLIDSILRGFDIPKLFLREQPRGSEHLFQVVDGKQRLTAIWRFMSDEFALLRNVPPLPDFGDLGGKTWSGLSRDVQDALQFTNLTVSRIVKASEDEIHELFLRLQRGEPLNAAEVRNAMPGPIREFVAETMVKHPFWRLTGLRSQRFGYDEHAAILLLLVKHRGPASVKGPDLHNLYQEADLDSDVAARATCLLDTLESVAQHGPKEIRTRWGLVDLAISLMQLDEEDHVILPIPTMRFFQEFEAMRRDTAVKLGDLQTRFVEDPAAQDRDEIEFPDVPSDMWSYHMAFSREGATKARIEERSTIMYRRLLTHYNEVSA